MIGSGPLGASPLGGPGDSVIDSGVPAAGLTQLHRYTGSSAAVISIRQGDSIGLKYGLNDESLADWTCDVVIKTYAGQAEPEYELTLDEITDDDTRYIGMIPGTVTALLDPRRYIIVADLYNSDTGEAKEYAATLIVVAQSQVAA